jgi:uncharacterized surface protein with fasciclin (FAS1) repeats
MKKKFALLVSMLVLAALVLGACAPAAPEPTAPPPPAPTEVPMMEEEPEEPMEEEMPGTIVDIAVADGRFSTLVAAVTAADLAETLSSEGPFTVFAPTDDAFAMLPEGTVEALLEDIPQLSNILLYHVVPGKVMAADVVELELSDTAAGIPVRIRVEDGNVYIN